MSRRAAFALCLAPLLSACREPQPTPQRPSPAASPALILWAWETPEDLRLLNPHTAGVAFLSRELFLGPDGTVTVRNRHQPLLLANGAWIEAVVRIEPQPNFVETRTTAAATARAIAAAASAPNVQAIQVDFDATASQRDLYRRILQSLRTMLPPGMPISITSLVSWCGAHSWLAGLPIDEAVPMFFRMGGPGVSRATASKDAGAVREKLCTGSVGVSTDEAWPVLSALPPSPNGVRRVYVFHPGSWTQEEIARTNATGYQGLNEVH